MPSWTLDKIELQHSYCPSSEGIFAVHTPIKPPGGSTDSGLVVGGIGIGDQCGIAWFVGVDS
jgi:hypothetical protein